MFGNDIIFLGVLLLLLLVLIWVLMTYQRHVVYEFERALLYRHGKFLRLLGPGRYWLNRLTTQIHKVDVRPRFVTLSGQEVLSADNVTIKVSLAANYKVDDPYRAVHAAANYLETLYLLLQLQLREVIGSLPIDELLQKRQEIGDWLLENTRPQAAEIGIGLLSVGIKDVMFPGELKKIFAQVVNARKEGLAALERARGESAALRNLANTARLLENNPALFQLRLLQTFNTSSGNTLILKLPDGTESEFLPNKAQAQSEGDLETND